MRPFRLSVKNRLFLVFSSMTLALEIAFFAISTRSYEQNIMSDLDAFLVTEASSCSLAMGSFMAVEAGGKGPTDHVSTDMLEYATGYLKKFSDKILPYKTTVGIFDRDGSTIALSNNAIDLLQPAQAVRGLKVESSWQNGSNIRMIRLDIEVDGQRFGEIRMGAPTNRLQDEIRSFGSLTALVLFLVWLAVLGSSRLMVAFILAPVGSMTKAVHRIAGSNLTERVPELPGKDELAKLALTFNETLDRLETSWKFQESLMGTVSHQLRTPITALRGTLELARDNCPEGSVADKLMDAVGQIEDMTNLLNAMLRMARLDSQGTLPSPGLHDLRGLVEHYIQDADFLWQEKEIRLEVEGTVPGTRCTVWADQEYLAQVFLNLFDNAARFVPVHGTIDFSFSNQRRDEHLFVVVNMENNGPTLPSPPEIVFERFFRSPHEREGSLPTFGLGLPIARRIMELHGGFLEAYVPQEGGAGFSLGLPLVEGHLQS